MHDEERRRELARFLRTRRAGLSPTSVGLPPGVRRRTPGLRREEVAQLANVSVEWYTRLEQGRDIRASVQAVENIAQALQLNADERTHVFHLALQQPPPSGAVSDETVSLSLQRFLDALGTNPAYVMGRRWDRLAWNTAACLVFGDFSRFSLRDRNVLWFLFTDVSRRRLFVDWEGVAQRVLAEFRTSYGRYAGDPAFSELVKDLQRVSPEFRRWWPRHYVQGSADGRKELEHPVAGRLVLEHHTFQVSETPHLTVVVYTPLYEADTRGKLEKLFSGEREQIREGNRAAGTS